MFIALRQLRVGVWTITREQVKLSAVLALFIGAGSAQAQVPLAIALFDYDAKTGQAQFDVVNQSGKDITGGTVGFLRDDQLVSSVALDVTPGMIMGNELIHPGGVYHMSQPVRSRRDGSIPQSVQAKPVAVIYPGGKSDGDPSAMEGTFKNRRAMAAEFRICAKALEHVRLADLDGVLREIRAARKIEEESHTLDRHPLVLATVQSLCDGVQRRVQDGSTSEAEAMQFLRDYMKNGAKIMAAERGGAGAQ